MALFEKLKSAARADWDRYVLHPFVDGLAAGSLAEAAFRRYLEQDYLFLVQFARAHALAVYKARDFAGMRAQSKALAGILETEMGLHVRVCARWGVTEADLAAGIEARETVAYTRFVLDEGIRGDLLDLMVSLAPCTVGYAEIARRLARLPGALAETNPYRDWILDYSSDAYQVVAAAARDELDRLAARLLTPARFDDLAALFGAACRLEADFWQMGLDAAG
jgi:thiaminase/transcriptional activator TenA